MKLPELTPTVPINKKMTHRIEISTKVNDTRSQVMKTSHLANYNVESAKVIDVYTINKNLSEKEVKEIAEILANPISQTYEIKPNKDTKQKTNFDFALETGFLPGVTDNIGTTAKECIEDYLKTKFKEDESVHSSTLILLKGKLTAESVGKIGESLANKLIQRIHIKDAKTFEKDLGMDIIIPKVKLKTPPPPSEINLDISEEDLIKLGKEGIINKDRERNGPLALDKESILTIKEYFKKIGRNPTDIELESLAQTWSEHCKHTIFAAKIDNNEEGLYKGLIKKATQEIRKKKGKNDFCVSVFSDNSGGIIFDENWIITDKAETHNSPSALDPFGGAITGIVGVNRDTIGFGKGAKPIINKYGFCTGFPDDEEPIFKDKNKAQQALTPKRIFNGIVEGVKVGGNCSGIPTPQGFICFHKGYKGKPLVFVGTVGLIPKKINGEDGCEKKANKGDLIIVAGGRVGQDGIHGATFSSEALSQGSPATAVQIGDPITQKKLSDAIIKEARDQNLYNSITDNGAGGLSCSIAEMAKECGGCEVNLDKVPLKYPNLEPWKIWISESQERMTLSVPKEKAKRFIKLMEKRGVEATIIGEFTDSGRCVVRYENKTIMDLEMDFLHDGVPRKTLKTSYKRPTNKEPTFKNPDNLTKILEEMLSRPNITSFEFIPRQYDHCVQGGTVLGPIEGKGRVNTVASVTKPFLNTQKGIVCSQGINPIYSEIDTYHMSACAIDTAIRNNIAVGGKLSHMALMDNFCWCSPTEEQRLGELKSSVQACYDYSTAYETPFISGKDSMFNDFSGFDKDGNPIKISVPPTLLISSISVMDDVTKSISLDPKFAGDLIYILGKTKNELGGSEYFAHNGYIGNTVPKVDAKKAIELYKKYEEAVAKRLISSSISVGIGGIGIALAKKAIAGQLGMDIDLNKIPKTDDLSREDYLLFSESQSRFIVTIDPSKKEEFEKTFKGVFFVQIGQITDNQKFTIKGLNEKEIINTDISNLEKSYKKTFKDY